MRPEDIQHLTVPGAPALRGDLLLTAVSRPDLNNDGYRGGIRRIGLDGSESAWTQGDRDSAPAISPDGHWVAFLRTESGSDARPQLHVMPSAGGESRRLTSLALGAGAPVWAPDSRRIAFTARVPEPGRYGVPRADGEKAEAESPRRITGLHYRLDDTGFLNDRPQRLFVVDTVTGDLSVLTDGAVDVDDPAWHPDGTSLIVSAPQGWVADTARLDLYAIPAAGGEPRVVARSAGTAMKPAVAPDGAIWFYGAEFPGNLDVARNDALWVRPASGGEPRLVTEIETVDCDPAVGPPVIVGDEVYFVVRTRGEAQLVAVPRDASEVPLAKLRVIAGERAAVRGFAVDGSTVAAVISTPSTYGEVVLLDGGTPRVLTDYAKPVRDKGIFPMEELTGTAPDGYPVHGWVVKPEGEGPHPVILMVHGGPFAPYEWSLFDEAQVCAAAGYAVVLANPRGSASYGQNHGQAIVGAMGTVDADDLLAFLDAALALPELDASRVGVMGGSYGGYMTGWLAAHHGSRFRAAWSERAVNAWDSFVGSSDIGWFFAEAYVGPDPEVQRARSPLTYADQIDIPFCVVHSEHDWRCPIEQAQRMFVALKSRGVETEMLLFPGEGHELTRSGNPRHRVERFHAVLEWWGRHLG
ncbi:S9 family peptidase [Amycolatopsis sp. NPDC059657]|uniref:S9 family peptidase n=1 Tax=Amycolatopsis sp. NPDC059657 TaxID=3346899 RepID=UPI00366E8E71